MASWNIFVNRQKDDRSAVPSIKTEVCAPSIAIWQVGFDGLGWLKGLVREQKALALGGSGYPDRYAAQALHILPYLQGELPDAREHWAIGEGDVLVGGFGRNSRDMDAINACDPAEWLVIDIWDQS